MDPKGEEKYSKQNRGKTLLKPSERKAPKAVENDQKAVAPLQHPETKLPQLWFYLPPEEHSTLSTPKQVGFTASSMA